MRLTLIDKVLGLPEYRAGIERLNPPKTLEELKQRLGPLGVPAAERAEWGAVVRWLSDRPEATLDPAKTKRLCQAVMLFMDAQACRSGIPTIMGEPLEAPYAGFHRSRQSRIKKAAMEVRGLWRAAGEPSLEASIGYISDYMRTAMRKAQPKVLAG